MTPAASSLMQFQRRCALILGATIAIACEGPQGPAGSAGPPGPEGPPATPTTDGGVPRVPIIAGPGLVLDIAGAEIRGSTVTATISITDGEGTPLDRAGTFTAGEVELSFVIARLDEDPNGEPLQYTAYTTRT